MKTIFTYFWVILLVVLSIAASAQNGEMAMNNTLTGKEHLPYNMVPDICAWENIAGIEEDSTRAAFDVSVLYNKKNEHITIDGTDRGGDVEVWDVNGNTVFTKASGKPKTEFKVTHLRKGSYFINYSNGKNSEGVKLTIK
jgi:hypothetical protein